MARALLPQACACGCGGFNAGRGRFIRGHAHRIAHPLAGRSGAAAAHFVHGKDRTPTHSTWVSMRQRCLNPNNPAYPRYGGRGIAVCERWSLFANFLADMGERPPGTTLDRIHNDRGYEPDNCRWATAKQQSQNRRCVKLSDLDRAHIAANPDGLSKQQLAASFGITRAYVGQLFKQAQR